MSSSSLYGNVGNVTVSANNLTTLYNATGGNIVTANVPDRDFTTLYTKQSDIKPTLPYGNSNVESFLNVGFDSGGNIVENINANGYIHANGSATFNGNLTIGGISNFGPASNVHITGGSSGYVLTTDGQGNLQWLSGETGNSAPYIHFDVTTTANNQQFTNTLLARYSSNVVFSLFKNGVNIEPFYYEKSDANTVQVNILLNTGDTVDILPSSGGGGLPAGNIMDIQFNGGFSFGADDTFNYDMANSKMSVVNANIGNVTVGHLTVQEPANLTIGGGFANWVLTTDGLGNVVWQAQADANGHPAGSNTQVQFNSGANSFAATADFTYDSFLGELRAPIIIGNGSQLTHLNGANVEGVVANAIYAVTANIADSANIANIANIAYSVSGSNVVGTVSSSLTSSVVSASSQPAITSLGNLTGITSNGNVNFTSASNVSLGSVSTLHIPGGSANYVLSTDGAGNISWNTPLTANATPGGSNTYVQFNDNGAFNGNVNFTFDKVNGILTTIGVITKSLGNVASASEYVAFTGGVSSSLTFDTTISSIIQATTNTAGNFVINFTNLSLSTGQSRTFAYINKNAAGSTYHCTGVSIAGVAQTVNWLGGAAPTVGSTNDIYNITVIKTGLTTYSVFASLGSY